MQLKFGSRMPDIYPYQNHGVQVLLRLDAGAEYLVFDKLNLTG